jgi:hypothetical protein
MAPAEVARPRISSNGSSFTGRSERTTLTRKAFSEPTVILSRGTSRVTVWFILLKNSPGKKIPLGILSRKD